MAFDYRKFERRASLGSLASLGCSRTVLKQAACRYGIASMLPGERRTAMREAGISVRKLERQVRDARELGRTLARLQQNPRVVMANSTPQTVILYWRQALEEMAQWLNALPVFRPDAKEAACALAKHVQQQTGTQHLPQLCDLLNTALNAAGLSPTLTVATLKQQITRANAVRAEEMLQAWELLPQ